MFSNAFARGHRALQQLRTEVSFRHLFGDRNPHLGGNDVVVICLIKDGAFFLPRFLDHHFGLGAKHVVLIDNGSTDETLNEARRHKRVTVVRSLLPAKHYESLLRAHAVRRFGRDSWCLVVDVDELFDYPSGDRLNLSKLVGYLDLRGFTAVVSQMLDMFPAGSLVSAGETAHDYDEVFNFYDLSMIEEVDYTDISRIPFAFHLRGNVASNTGVKFMFGGTRKRAFGTNNCLTKHSLIRLKDGLTPVTHPHCSSHAYCADFTAVLRHYKLAGNPHARMREEVSHSTWSHGENGAILDRLDQGGELVLTQDSSVTYRDARDLVERGFLVSSPAFERWVHGEIA